MRLLHTSDWHIGRSLHGADLLADQEAVLGGLADVVAAESVDVGLVAGDVYDRAAPPPPPPAAPRRAPAPGARRSRGSAAGWPSSWAPARPSSSRRPTTPPPAGWAPSPGCSR